MNDTPVCPICNGHGYYQEGGSLSSFVNCECKTQPVREAVDISVRPDTKNIVEIDANLLEYPLDGFMHQANCMHTMGGGIAARIKAKYPEAFKADLSHGRRGDPTRLGKFSWVKAHDDKIIYNLYGQYNLGMWYRQTNYEAVYNGMTLIRKHAIENNVLRLGLPRNMGCRLGGGSWNVVSAMVYDIFLGHPINIFICNYDG